MIAQRTPAAHTAIAAPDWITPFGKLDSFDVLLLAIVRLALLDLTHGLHGRIHDRSRPGPAAYWWFTTDDCAWIINTLAPEIDTAEFSRRILDRYWPEPEPPPILVSGKG